MDNKHGLVPEWVEGIRKDLKNIRADIDKLSADIQYLKTQQAVGVAPPGLPSCLVVEDDELIAHVLVHLLEREGYDVQRCADGRAAQQAIEQARKVPDLILLDIMLPYVDGFELIQVIRKKMKWLDVPIVMLSSKLQESEIVRAFDAGATDYIVKPFQPNELMARLRRILRSKGEEK